jgi:hypothetical protein
MDDKEFWRNYLLAGACAAGEPCQIEGVEFDLSHPDLHRDEWVPTTLLGSFYHADRRSPRLLFPWASDRERDIFEQRGQGLEVHVGDKLIVASVQRMGVKADHGRLDHPQHQERRWAHLLILRALGVKVPVEQAWEFQGASDVMTPIVRRDYKRARSALLARMGDALGLESINDLQLADSPSAWPTFAVTATELDRLAAKVLWDAESEYIEEAAMVFGYLVGRAEARALLLPHAQRQIELRDQRRQAAKLPRKAGDKTRAAARGVIVSTPDIIRSKCAEKVATIRDLHDVRSVERTIAPFFEKSADGRLRPTSEAIAAAKAQQGGGT